MSTVSEILALTIGFDVSGVESGEQEAERSIGRVSQRVQQQASELERVTRDVTENIFAVLRYAAGLAGVVFSIEGVRKLVQNFADANTALGRFAEAAGVSATNVSALEQALERAGGRAEEVRTVLSQMRQDVTRVQLFGENIAPWMNNLGRLGISPQAVVTQPLEKTLLDISKQAGARHVTPAQLGSYLTGLNLPENLRVLLTKPEELERLLRDVARTDTAVKPEHITAAERLKEQGATLGQLAAATINDLITLTEPALTKLLQFITTTLSWVDKIERLLLGERPIETPNVPVTPRSERSSGIDGGVAGGPRVGAGGANYMRGALPSSSELTTVQTASGQITVNRAAADDMRGFVDDLVAAGAPREAVGSHARRLIAGTNTWSQHAYGTAIDYGQKARNIVDPAFRLWANEHPDVLESILRKRNMVSGGNWRNPDFGHFEWAGPRPSSPDSLVRTSVRGSTFSDASTASGLSARTTPGIAVPSGGRMGDLYDVTTPDGRTFTTRLIDRGPAAWTGRGVDVSEALARQMGYDPKRFPTDSKFVVKPHVSELPNVGTGAAAAVGEPSPIDMTTNNDTTAVINHITVNTTATNAAGIASDVRREISDQLSLPARNE